MTTAARVAVAAGVLAFAASLSARAPELQRPNVLFLLADDHQPDAVAALGNPHVRTPSIDALAATGFRFRANYCFGSNSGAVCLPSRAMIMSGRTLWHVPHDLAGVTTLGETLAARGYETFGTGKWHNGDASFLRSFERGRAVFLGGMSDHTRVPIRDVRDDGSFTEKTIGDGFSSTLFADAVIEFLNTRDTSRPFFAYVAFTAPHDPRQPPEPYRAPYYDARLPLPPNYLPQHPFRIGDHMTVRDEVLAPWPRPPEVIRDQIAEYYGLITHMDEQIGRILASLRATGAEDDTIIVFTADHGLAMGRHGLLGKQNLYEHSMGCPLIITGPGIPKGESAALTYLHDLFPTLCDLTGAEVPEGVEGVSLRPVWEGGTVRDMLFTAYRASIRSVRDERWKLIVYPRVHRRQLFDLRGDPHETVNLIDHAAQHDRIAGLTEALEAWRARTDDPDTLWVDDPEDDALDLAGFERNPDRHQPSWIREKYFDSDGSASETDR